MAKRAGLALLVAFVASRVAAAPDPALRCQRAIERGGLGYARALLDAASECATDGGGPIDACLDAAIAGGPALRARFHRIEGLRPGAGGELYIGDVENHRVRMIDRHGSVITIAGTGVIGTDPDFAPASLHTIGFPAELTVHPDGRVFFDDTCANFVEYLRVPVPF